MEVENKNSNHETEKKNMEHTCAVNSNKRALFV